MKSRVTHRLHGWLPAALLCLACLVVDAAPDGRPDRPPNLPGAVRRMDAPEIENLFRLGTNVLSGGSPEGDAAFARLARLGVRTILSVDGSKPDVEGARRHGLRYVHLPHGYDGIGTNLQRQLVKAARTLPGPIYVHCHHGRHRGPAAAAILCMATDGWTSQEAKAWLTTAGTSPDYDGLFQTVQRFRNPAEPELDATVATFPETASVSGMIEAMVEIDRRWDHLKAVRNAGYQVPSEHPDLRPTQEAILLGEHFREAQRLPENARRGEAFLERLKAAEIEAVEAAHLLKSIPVEATSDLRRQLDKHFDAIGRSCISCHRAHRDPSEKPKP